MTEEDKERYHRALHAMQTGVQVMMGIDSNPMIPKEPGNTDPLSPKHLRTGINSALCDSSAITKLLVEKGVITWDEVYKALADEMEAEVERYRKIIKERIGMDVNLI